MSVELLKCNCVHSLWTPRIQTYTWSTSYLQWLVLMTMYSAWQAHIVFSEFVLHRIKILVVITITVTILCSLPLYRQQDGINSVHT